MYRIVLCGALLQTLPLALGIFGCSLPLAVAIFGYCLPLAGAIFGYSLPLAVATFLVIWHFYLRTIAIFVEVVEFAPPCHRQKPQSKTMPHQFSAVSGAATRNYSHPRLCCSLFIFGHGLKVASKIKPPGLLSLSLFSD